MGVIVPRYRAWWEETIEGYRTVMGKASLDERWEWRNEEQDVRNAERARSWALRYRLAHG